MLYRSINACRICGGSRLSPFLNLGEMPLANGVRDGNDASPEPRVPLSVLFCHDCALSQLSVVVRPELMFRHYVYRSGISRTFLQHCRSFAQEAESQARLPKDALIVDIGANDGTLLGAFRDRGYRTVGVDPARNLSVLANEKGIEMLPEFWSRATAETFIKKWGRPSLITATNVVAHVDDLVDFFDGIAHALGEDGRFIVEVPYLADLIEKNEFDTIYHEHLNYFLLRPLLRIAGSRDMTAAYVRRTPIHGGGIRVYFKKGKSDTDTVRANLAFEEESGLYAMPAYLHFARQINSIRADLEQALARLRAEGKRVAAYGASAKGATLLNSIKLERGTISYIVDDTPEKQGKIAPGTGIPIVPAEQLSFDPPDYLLILAWNFVNEIIEKTEAFSQKGGRYIVPVPALRFID